MMLKPCRVLLLTHDAELLRAVSDAGLEAWTLRRTGADGPSRQHGPVPPERTLTTEDPARTLRDLASGVRAHHGIDFVIGGDDAHPAVLDVLRTLVPGGRTGVRPPDRAELRRLLDEGPAPCPAPADDGAALLCHVDTVTVGGMHLLLDISWPNSPTGFGESERAGVREAVRRVLDLIGHESGGMRTCVALTTTGPRPVDLSGTPFLVASLAPGTTR
ncbi:hypothetical protein ACFYYR_24205 [Streptomyces sp. NPDC001922]|uniref:hypothetical protein n=1 Tax=Streptomyces sp. NPDC001922 TaxID=3364624 RepID=UPI0036CDFBB7